MRKSIQNVMKVVFVVIGTLVGAGFASGREIFSFFFVYSFTGIIGIIFSCSIIGCVVYRVFYLCKIYDIKSYHDFCNKLQNLKVCEKVSKNNFKFSYFLNCTVNLFLLITFYVMVSGFSSFLKQEFSVNSILGSIMIVTLCYFIFLKNINGLIKISNYLIPISIFMIICISMKNIEFIKNYNVIFNTNEYIRSEMFCIKGLFMAILYGCYNCIILIPVLVTLRKQILNNQIMRCVSIVSCIILLILSFAIYNLLLQGNEEIFSLEMPIVEIVKRYGESYKVIYRAIIGVSIFTTAVSSGCSLLNNCSKSEMEFRRNLVLISVSALFFSQISFSMLVNYIYPVLGIFGAIEIFLIFKIK